jgi:hypothetical protein
MTRTRAPFVPIRLVAVLVLGLVLAAPPAFANERYDPRRAGHPLRIAGYILHPVGVVLDTLIFHPAWWIGSYEPIRTLVGRRRTLDDAALLESEADESVDPSKPLKR